MKQFQALLIWGMIIKIHRRTACFLIAGMLINSCQSQKLKPEPEIVLSEIDTFRITTDKNIFTKYDYWLLNANLENLRAFTDSMANAEVQKKNEGFNNYIILFYKRTKYLNKKVILKEEKQYRYKFFQDYRDQCFIAEYDFRYEHGILKKPFVTWHK